MAIDSHYELAYVHPIPGTVVIADAQYSFDKSALTNLLGYK